LISTRSPTSARSASTLSRTPGSTCPLPATESLSHSIRRSPTGRVSRPSTSPTCARISQTFPTLRFLRCAFATSRLSMRRGSRRRRARPTSRPCLHCGTFLPTRSIFQSVAPLRGASG
jgi:hypothetical protein